MELRKDHALLRKLIQHGSLDQAPVVAHIPPAQIIGKNEHDIWKRPTLQRISARARREPERKRQKPT